MISLLILYIFEMRYGALPFGGQGNSDLQFLPSIVGVPVHSFRNVKLAYGNIFSSKQPFPDIGLAPTRVERPMKRDTMNPIARRDDAVDAIQIVK